MEAGHAVDGQAACNAQVGHPYLAAPDNSHLFGDRGIVEEILHLFLPAAGDLLNDLPHAGQQGLHQLLRPALQRLGKDRVVGIGHGARGDVPRLVPVHARLVHEDPHQLRNHQSRMGVIDLNDVFLMEVLQGAIGLQMLGDNGLHRGRNEEILLLQPQGLSLVVVILRVEDLGDGLRHGLVLGGFQIFAAGKQGHVHRAGGPGIPQPERVDVVGIIARHHHVAGNGQHGGGVLVDNVEMAVMPEFPKGTAKVDGLRLVGLGQQPSGANTLPVIRQLHLLTFHDLLLENTQLIADGVAGSWDVQRGHGVQIAGGQAAQTAVAQTCVRFQLKQVAGLEAQVAQSLLQFGQHAQIVSVFHQAPAHEKFQREIVDLLFLLLFCFLGGLYAPEGHHIPQHQSAGFQHLLIRGFPRLGAEVQGQLGGQGVL